jgi:lysine 2,3-aminomutase
MPNGTTPAKSLTSLRTARALVRAGLVAPDREAAIADVARKYAVAISPALAALIADAEDPIGRQFVPDPTELETAPEESADPIADEALSPIKGIVHRYPDRALLKPILACPVYCRFCFRREQVGPDGGVLREDELAAAYAWLAARPAIREVILTGGDPLMLSPRRLGAIVAALSAIPHLESLRVHSRMPVAEPERITAALAASLAAGKPMWLVLHANHAREITEATRDAVRRLLAAGIPVLGQSVLLAGVNDSEEALASLFRAMTAARIKPYYLHQLDRAPGTARFHVPIARGRALLAGLRGKLPGHAFPTYVIDIPGGAGKVPIGPDFLAGEESVRDLAGRLHRLAPAMGSG